jgi:hypothetical protein
MVKTAGYMDSVIEILVNATKPIKEINKMPFSASNEWRVISKKISTKHRPTVKISHFQD